MSNIVRAEKLPRAAAKAPRKESELGRIVRLLGRFSKGQRKPFVLGFAMLIAEMLTALADGLPLALVLDYLSDPVGNPDLPTYVYRLTGLTVPPVASPLVLTVGVLAGAVVLIAMLNSLTDSLAEIYLAKGGRLLGYTMRVGLYSHLQKLSLAFYGRQRTGDLLTRVTSDVSAIEDFITTSLSDIVGGLLTLIGTVIVVFYLSWQVGVVALLLVPLLALVSNYFSQRVKAASKKARAREGELASRAQEMLTSIRVIQAYGSGGVQVEQFSRQSQKTMESSLEAAGIQARFSFTFKVLESAILAGIICLGVFLNVQQLIALGTLVFLVKKIDDMFKPTKKIIKEWNTVGKIYASVERIGELLDRKPAVEDAPDARVAPRFQGNVAFDGVSFAYMPEPEDVKAGQAPQPKLALRDVSFTIAPGEVVALVGSSGAGKSTIAQLLPRLYDPHAGSITIDGQDIRSFTLDSLRAQMSMVLQEAILFAGTVAENIAYGQPDATREEVIAAAMRANAHDFIQRLPDGYDTQLDERAGNLSGGQRQRIAIARAFIRNTPILILDEPTTGLDAESTELVLLALRELMRGKATIIISHDLNLIRQADTIIAIKDGQIVQTGAHKQLLKEGGLYADLYHKQFGHAVEEQRAGLAPIKGAQAAEEDDEDAPAVTPKMFQTMIGMALPAPASAKDFQTMMVQAVIPPPDAPTPAAPQAPASAKDFQTMMLQAVIPPPDAPTPVAPLAPAAPAGGAGDTLLDSPIVQEELPGLKAAFDTEAMRGYLQRALFGKTRSQYTVEECAPGKAVYLGDSCVLRYELVVKDSATGETLRPLVVGRVFGDQLACALYLRDKLAPLATLMRGRPEVAPFANPVAMVEPLNMAVHVFPIDGELPTLVGATDRQRMMAVFSETLPEARAGHLTIRDCRIVPVNYARRHRCVLRYEIEGVASDNTPQRRDVYGKVAADGHGALIALAIAALREQLPAGAGLRFEIPRSLGFRPDLQLALLEAIPGTPRINQLLKARLSGAASDGALTLEAALETCAHIAAALHTSSISLGRRRTLNDDLAALQKDIRVVQRVSPELGAQFQAWWERIEAYAEESDPLGLCFSHGDYTHAQVIFDDTRAGLVDFDTVCQAEPALDLGQFLAYMRVAAHKARREAAPGAVPIGEQLGERFLNAYIEAAGPRLEDADRLRVRASVYQAVSLMRMALHSWQQIKPARVENALAVLQETLDGLPQLDY